MMSHCFSSRRRPVTGSIVISIALVIAGGGGCSRQFEDKWSRARPKTYPTSGRVLWNGKPVENAIVALDSEVHTVTAVGTTDAQGLFRLETYRPGDGAVAGRHRVRIEKLETKSVTADGINQISVMPQRYCKAATSGLTATVTEDGKTKLLFEVTGLRVEVRR
jgi:hypothetical protein